MAARARPRTGAAGWTPWIWGLCAVGAALRLWGIGSRSFWFDEGVTVLAARDLTSLWNLRAAPLLEPPLYATLLGGWMRLPLPFAEWSVRLPSALASIAALPLAHAVARRWLGPPAAALALALLALSPYEIAYAQEARMYAFLVPVSLAAVLLLPARGGRRIGRSRWSAFGACMLAGGLLHPGTLLQLPAHAALLASLPATARRRAWRPFLAAGLAAALPAVLWLAAHAEPWGNALRHPGESGRTIARFAAEALAAHGAGAMLPAGWHEGAMGAFAAAFLLGLRAVPAGVRLTLAALAVAPLALLFAAAQAGMVHAPILRYVIGAHPYFLMVCAAGAASLPPRARTGAAALLLFLCAGGAAPYLRGAPPPRAMMPAKKPLRHVAAYIRERARSGDVVVHLSAASFVPMRLYGPGGLRQGYVIRDPTIPPPMERLVGSPVPLPRLLRGARRMWLVASPVRFGDPAGIPAAFAPALGRCCSAPVRFAFPGLDLYLADVTP